MTFWTGALIGFGALALIETAAVMIGAGIPIMKDKIRKRRKGRP